MTLLVAIKVPTAHLNPLRQPLNFSEPCIVMGVDTRFTLLNSKHAPIDDAMKIWRVSSCSIAGYSGDVELAERAFYSAFTASEIRRLSTNPRFMLVAIGGYLQYWGKVLKERRNVIPTVVFVGLHSGPRRFELWEMRSALGFSARRRSGINIAGSGAEAFRPVLRKEIEHAVRSWAAPAKTGLKIETDDNGKPRLVAAKQGDRIEIQPNQVGGFALGAVDLIVSKAGLSHVGGWSRVLVMRENGVFPIYGHVVAPQKRAISRDDLRGYIPRVAPRQFEAPLIDEFGGFPKGESVLIRFS